MLVRQFSSSTRVTSITAPTFNPGPLREWCPFLISLLLALTPPEPALCPSFWRLPFPESHMPFRAWPSLHQPYASTLSIAVFFQRETHMTFTSPVTRSSPSLPLFTAGSVCACSLLCSGPSICRTCLLSGTRMISFLFGNLLTVLHEFPKNYTSEHLPSARTWHSQALKRLFVEIKHFQLLGARHDERFSFLKIILKPGVVAHVCNSRI